MVTYLKLKEKPVSVFSLFSRQRPPVNNDALFDVYVQMPRNLQALTLPGAHKRSGIEASTVLRSRSFPAARAP